ncbi:hypothetical protein HWQ46_10195 [Shewanella sp. D64]|uniref:hypothetical protein n=1 Tax=unclassified Shewanella TaxID=196818 RepID=UPI0022BA16D4|nr:MULTISPECIES: hypothetical protein [unclassified Shewanella]MEC4725915.1 hypothetical protein [Shewanella sp. D64]MEC4737170.1 hypothetical protein [Shewanella sp. E94]WBJ95638.1 hypothetical protein HWQ47_00440 [Shewanella sp. MTB7]
MKQLLKLCQQEEKKLSELGRQRSEAHHRITQISKQQLALTKMLTEYQAHSPQLANSLLLQNNINMQLALKPMQTQLTRQQRLLEHEHQRMDGLWRKQLGRQQGIKWFCKRRHQEQLDAKSIKEQKQLDDLAGRCRLSFS